MKLIGTKQGFKTKKEAVKNFFLLKGIGVVSISKCAKHYDIEINDVISILLALEFTRGHTRAQNETRKNVTAFLNRIENVSSLGCLDKDDIELAKEASERLQKLPL